LKVCMNLKDIMPKPVDYRMWGLMQELVCKRAARDTSDVKQHLIGTWASVSQNIVDEAVDQWKKHLHACEKAKGRHFEHLLN